MTSPDRKIVTPTVGRKVWFRLNGIPTLQRANIDEHSFAIPKLISTQPLDATVVYVWDDRMVNLAVRDHYGNNFVASSVVLVQEGDDKPSNGGYYCEWMPYQTAQAKKEQAGIEAANLFDRYAARAASALTATPTRQTHREALAVTLAEKIGVYIGESPDKAKTIADAVKAVLDVLAPESNEITGADVAAALSSTQHLPFVLDGSQEKFGTVSIDSAIEQQIQAAGADKAPRVTPAALKDEIVSEHYFTAADGAKHLNAHNPSNFGDLPKSLGLLTFCVLVLRNGFTVHGMSACASPANFNAKIGRQIARENAERQIWPLLGFRLRDELSRPVLTDADAAADLAGTPRP